VKVFVDDRAVEVPAGTSAMDALFEAGRDVPYFCSLPYLSPIGACRMCLVEAGSPRRGQDGQWILDDQGQPKIFWLPKPMASCTLAASEGMVIRTQTDAVRKAQAGMVEFTLLNHPLDCPTCDKGGACELQDRSYEYGYGASRFVFDRRHADKHYPLSDLVVLDQERCIHCKRCVRYFEEIPGQEMIDFIERGVHTFIDGYEGGLPSAFSGNIVDLCPVGALLDNVARFRGRNWEYDHTATICTGCSVGCSVTVDARNGRVERIVGRDHPAVNERWICDAGRFSHALEEEGRLTTPLLRRGGELVPASFDEVLAYLTSELVDVPPAQIGLYSSSDITLEEGIALEATAQVLGSGHVDHLPRFSQLPALPRPTLHQLAQASAVVIAGADLGAEAPVAELRIQEMLRGAAPPPQFRHGTAIADLKLTERMERHPERLAIFSSAPTSLDRSADLVVRGDPQAALSAIAAALEGNAQAASPYLSAAELLRRPGATLVVGSELQAAGGLRLAEKVARSSGAALLALPADSNALGLAYLRLVPGEGGAAYGEAILPVALVSRCRRLPAQWPRLLIVHDTTLSALAARADVVLPAVSGLEKQGTLVNLEGRLQALRPAASEVGEATDLIPALGLLLQALGLRSPVRGLISAQRALAQRFGARVQSLPPEGALLDLGEPFLAETHLQHQPEVGAWAAAHLAAARARAAANRALEVAK
jgi:NADH-quinone oxidoreductase subunit G